MARQHTQGNAAFEGRHAGTGSRDRLGRRKVPALAVQRGVVPASSLLGPRTAGARLSCGSKMTGSGRGRGWPSTVVIPPGTGRHGPSRTKQVPGGHDTLNTASVGTPPTAACDDTRLRSQLLDSKHHEGTCTGPHRDRSKMYCPNL